MPSLILAMLLSALIQSSQAASSLSDIQQIINFPKACTNAYNTPLQGCEAATFTPSSADGNGNCNRNCFISLSSVVGTIQKACQGIPASRDTVIGHAYTGDLADFLCGTGKYAPSSTSSTSSSVQTSSSTDTTGSVSSTDSSSTQSVSATTTTSGSTTLSTSTTVSSTSSDSTSTAPTSTTKSSTTSTTTSVSKSTSRSTSTSSSSSAQPQQTQSSNNNNNSPKDSTPFDQGFGQNSAGHKSTKCRYIWILAAPLIAVVLSSMS